jgi:hypothetical protein
VSPAEGASGGLLDFLGDFNPWTTLAAPLCYTPPAGGDGATLQAPWPYNMPYNQKPGPKVQPSPSGGGARIPPKTEDGNPADANPGGGGKKPPGNGNVAAPGDENPFKDLGPFKTMDDACGLPPGSLDNMQKIGQADNNEMNKAGFKQKWIGQDWASGDWYSAYRNPSTGEWAGGKPSSHEP